MCRSHFILILALAFVVVVLSCAAQALADGGTVQFSQVIAPYRITVFTSPTPLGAGMIDISVLMQDAESGNVVQDAVIDLELSCESPRTTIRARAATETSANKLLQSVKLELPSAGVWRVFVRVQGRSTVSAKFNMTAYQASGNRATIIVLLALPFVMAGMFLLREHLVARQSSRALACLTVEAPPGKPSA